MSWRLWLPLLAFAGFLGLAAYQLTQPRDEIVESRMIGKALPYFDLEPATADLPGAASDDFKDGQPRLPSPRHRSLSGCATRGRPSSA